MLRTGIGNGSTGPLARRLPPGMIARFDFAGSVTDLVMGNPFSAVLPAVNGKYYDRFGVPCIAGPDQPRLNGLGAVTEGESTNKCTCVKYNPQSVAGLTQTAGAAVLSVVDDSAELIGSGFGLFAGNAYKLDNTSGGIDSVVTCSGITNNVNPHSLSVVVKGVGSLTTNSYVAPIAFNNPTYERVENEGIIPTGGGNTLVVRTAAGEITYFILPQSEESLRCSSTIVGDNTAAPATRATDAASAGVDGNGYKFNLSNNPALAASFASKGSLQAMFQPRFTFADGLTDLGLWTVNDTVEGPLYIGSDSKLTMSDGTNTVALDYAYSFEEQLDVRPWWGGNSMGLKLYDALGNLLEENGGAFAGSWPSVGYLKPHFGNEAACVYNSLSGFDNLEAA